ncbi:hypothetical protein BV25DRAFT_1918163 [Artomyces pyxidatus]|uniref:Uncharacterized protein n=1 Tax=Artomyces pyxidatus TaxID=48021 RepID=A0ACB8SUD0_9AGAM|nr:hypothetical protein BV25DRAFT_1918163 [Artomyces pyxidatus]
MLVLFFLAYACLHARSSDGLPTQNGPSILTRANSTAINIPSLVSSPAPCPDADNCRTKYNIVWSSLATIIACVWTAVHRNIPGPSQRRLLRMLEMARVVVVTLFQRLEKARAEAERSWEKGGWRRSDGGAGQFKPEVDADLQDSIPLTNAHPASDNSEEARLALNTLQIALEDGAGRLSGKWTIRHGFFIIMGGLHLYEGGEPRHPLSPIDVVGLVRAGSLVPPTEDEIKLLSQGDALSKGIAVLQILWFIIQYIARRAQGLPISQIEVMTLAYTTITVAMYAFWWYKPLNVGGPIRVVGKTLPERETVDGSGRMLTAEFVLGTQDDYVDLRQQYRVPTFYAGGSIALAQNTFNGNLVALIAAMVFGGVHCAAWDYVFPSRAETLLWRISSTAIIAVPGSLVISVVLTLCMNNTALEAVGNLIVALAFLLSDPLYVVARVVLLTLSFTSLRTLPAGAYQTVQWTIRIPHVS